MSLIIKISQNGSSQEYLFNKLGPILIGSDKRCDLHIDDSKLEPKLLEVKVSGGNIFIKEVGARAQIYLDSVILPYREETRYHEGESITLKDTNYQISICKAVTSEAIEPPPFFDGEFKERLERMNFKIHEKESELKQLHDKEEKKKNQMMDLEERYHHHANEKGRLEIEVNVLKTQKEALNLEIRRTNEKNQDTEDKIIQLKDFVTRLESEEQTLKETIVAQNLVLAGLKDEREKKSKDVDKQRLLLANLELDTLKAQEELKNIKEQFDSQEQEILHENGKIQKILNSSQEALKEGAKIQNHIAQALKEKTLLDHEVKDLQESVTKLENQRKDSQSKLLELKTHLEHEEQHSRKLKEEIQRQSEEENNLKLINGELRAELIKVEEKLSFKKNQLNQIDYQNQDITRKLSTINFELERSSLRLKELISEEKVQELKVLSLRDEFNNFAKKSNDDKKALNKSFDEEKSKLQMELSNLKSEIESERRNLAETESQKSLVEVTLQEIITRQRQISKEKVQIENEFLDLKNSKSQVEAQIVDLKNETIRIQHDKDQALRDLNSLKLKLMDCETRIKESLEEAHVEMENYKREERSKLLAEKEVYLSEVEAFRQKSLVEVENEYRRKEEDLHQIKQIALKESDEIICEAHARLKAATLEAESREQAAHARIKEANEYLKSKEREAALLMKRAEQDLQEDLNKRKGKIKQFLTMKQETGLEHIKQMTDQHMIRLRRSEEKAMEKLEEIKRKELKKVARLRDDELSRQHEMKEHLENDLKAHREKVMKEIHEQKNHELAELSNKKKSMLEHINETKFRSQKTWEEDMKREREAFERTKKERILNATQAVMNVFVSESGSQEDVLRQKIQSTLQMAIDGQNAGALKEVDQILDFNPMKRKQIVPVLKKYTIRFGIPAAIAIIVMADVGSVRTSVVNATKELIKSQQSASEMYVNQQKTEWKEKHTFNPQTTPGFKATYVDNILYTTDFEKVMENEEFQNEWILQVHEYMVKQLEFSEDIAINFISSEGTLMKELSTARKDLHPQFLENGLKKMNDLEKTHLGWLSEKIPDPAKMEKFKGFQKEYFDKFYNEKFSATRNIANETPK